MSVSDSVVIEQSEDQTTRDPFAVIRAGDEMYLILCEVERRNKVPHQERFNAETRERIRKALDRWQEVKK